MWGFGLVVILLVILIALVIVFLVLYETKDNDTKTVVVTVPLESTLPPQSTSPPQQPTTTAQSSTVGPSPYITNPPNPNAKCEELQQCKKRFERTPLLIISFDGFRNSYLQMNITPHIQRLFDCGTHSKYMIPSFPSKTFPNHYSIATGLYPAWHGIVDNDFRDPTVPGENFSQSTVAPGWYRGEPIWRTVQKNHLKSGVFFWPGSEAPDQLPTYVEKYDKSVPYTTRADKIIEWLKLGDDERPTLLQLYMEEPDAGGHKGGPGSQEVRIGMLTMDAVVNYLTRQLIQEGLMGCINIVLLSDHGMQYIDYNRAVLMDHYLPTDFKDILYTGVIAHLAVTHNDTNVDALVESMKCKNGTDYLVYKTKLTPSRFHYGGSSRNGQIVIQGRAGVYIMRNQQQVNDNLARHGNHGFDNRLLSMRAIFAAIGPDVNVNREIPEFENIELHNLFADLLRIEPAPNNGTKGHLYPVLKNPPPYVEASPIVDHKLCVENPMLFTCSSCPDLSSITERCSYDTPTVQYAITNGEECVVTLCDAVLHYNRRFGKVQMIETTVTSEEWKDVSSTCVSVIGNLSGPCPTTPTDNYISLFMNKDLYNTLDIARFPVSPGFKEGTWKFLVDKISHYVKFYQKLSMYVGVAYDSNGDSVRDSNSDISDTATPTHIFVVLLNCAENIRADRHNCKNPVTLTFILPIIVEDFNCLDENEYLFQNTARIRDVEILSGTEFFRDRTVWSIPEAIVLRTKVSQELWA